MQAKAFDAETEIEMIEDSILAIGATPYMSTNGGPWVVCSAGLYAHFAWAIRIGNSRAKDICLMLQFRSE
jgi:hypothetical protein